MSATIAALVAQLLAVRGKLDAAAVTAMRARADAEQAVTHLAALKRGSSDQRLSAAVADAEVARDKAGRYARLLANAARHITGYVNTIAPGAASSGSDDAASPSGERLVEEAEGRSRKAEAFLRRHVKKADDSEDTLKQTEQSITTGLRELQKSFKGSGSSGSTTSTSASPGTPVDRPQLEHPVTSVIMAAGAVVVGLRGVWNMAKKRRERKQSDEQP
ncbi:hypothetical protein FBZ33_0991 [Micromonospora sp. A202]|uniref:hypothetical protein n=1 Tax=Micromonospora sp. A202 TaxID=2572899 RepID=UPI00115379A7|nr:hypothetical protein [Micromonospora sp. A202]TQJ20787.1 hypothetical protein FBZ33_0991 [Micromonospora sp. A202]